MDYNKIIWFTHCATAANHYLKSKSLRREKCRLEREKNHVEMKLKFVRALITVILLRRRRRRRLHCLKPKINLNETENFWEETVSSYSDLQFKRAFRISRTTFNYICVTLYPFVRKVDTLIQNTIPLQKRIAITLMYLKGYSDFRSIACLFSVEESVVRSLVYEFCKVLIDCLWNKVIKFPYYEEDKVKLAERFEQKWKFPHCFGTLGRTNISSKYDSGERNLFLLGVVDDSYKFMFVDFNEEKSNKEFLKETLLYNEMLNTESNKYIISESSFPLLKWLLTPYQSTFDLSFYQKKYNSMINNVQKCTDEAFRRLKFRWQILLKGKLDSNNAELITRACIILHNISEDLHEDFPRHWVMEENKSVILEKCFDNDWNQEGRIKRDTIAKLLLRNGK